MRMTLVNDILNLYMYWHHISGQQLHKINEEENILSSDHGFEGKRAGGVVKDSSGSNLGAAGRRGATGTSPPPLHPRAGGAAAKSLGNVMSGSRKEVPATTSSARPDTHSSSVNSTPASPKSPSGETFDVSNKRAPPPIPSTTTVHEDGREPSLALDNSSHDIATDGGSVDVRRKTRRGPKKAHVEDGGAGRSTDAPSLPVGKQGNGLSNLYKLRGEAGGVDGGTSKKRGGFRGEDSFRRVYADGVDNSSKGNRNGERKEDGRAHADGGRRGEEPYYENQRSLSTAEEEREVEGGYSSTVRGVWSTVGEQDHPLSAEGGEVENIYDATPDDEDILRPEINDGGGRDGEQQGDSISSAIFEEGEKEGEEEGGVGNSKELNNTTEGSTSIAANTTTAAYTTTVEADPLNQTVRYYEYAEYEEVGEDDGGVYKDDFP